MGRRTSGQQVGLEKIGNVAAMEGMLSTTQTNQDMTLDPNGTGGVIVNGNITITNQQDLRLREDEGNGTNYIAMQAASSMSSNYTITWPNAVSAANGYVLSSDTSGNLSWASAGGNISVSDPGASATVHYPFFGTNAGSLPSTLTPLARTNLAFVPSTGELSATIGRFADVYGSTSSSGTVTIRGTSNATKASASVLMTDNVTSSSTSTGTLVVTGGVGVSGQVTCTTLVETSSIAFKENVNPLQDALDKILQLTGVIYDRKDGTSFNEAGLIAEDVNRIIPELVTKDVNGNPYGVKYTKVVAYLVESIKSLHNEIVELKSKK